MSPFPSPSNVPIPVPRRILLYKNHVHFRWNDWNWHHVQKHGVTPEEAGMVVEGAQPPYPQAHRNDTWLVIGRGYGGRFVQVVYLLDRDGTAYIIHARPLTDREKRRYCRRTN